MSANATENGRRTSSQEEIETWVVDNCRSLGLRVEGAESDFFSVGGTSLAATRLIARAEQDFGDDALPPDDLYEDGCLRAIAAAIFRNSRAVGVGGGDPGTA
ncbi:phosphopantetheine-binding protein [Actinospica robiniae]|uniref:phosphopantetheine-binding protein n=1 Tax=Actinospica robiniae TaxID=304901 RepID=UPI0003F9E1B2|nr:phosphopantetheine-binding protein [Actinospica robiniae]